jgi:hypothetical protein
LREIPAAQRRPRRPGYDGGSLEQLLLNVVLLIVVGAGGLSTQRAIWRRLRPAASEPPG